MAKGRPGSAARRLGKAIKALLQDVPTFLEEPVRDAVELYALEVTEQVREGIRSGTTLQSLRGAKPPGAKLESRSGMTRASIQYAVHGEKLGKIGAVVWSSAGKRAWAHEYGTRGKAPDSPVPTITPKKSRFLAIPLRPALTASGRAREGKLSPRDFADLHPIRRKSGKLFLAKPEGGRLTLYFMLVRRVDLYPRLGMRRAWTEQRIGLLRGLQSGIAGGLRKLARERSGEV